MNNASLTLIVDPDISTLYRYGFRDNLDTISVGRELSEFLLSGESGYDRTQSTIWWLENIVREKNSSPILCVEIDILFEDILKLDPLELFRRISRGANLLVLWPGEFKNGVLSYSVPEHKNYRFWKDLTGVNIKGVNDAL